MWCRMGSTWTAFGVCCGMSNPVGRFGKEYDALAAILLEESYCKDCPKDKGQWCEPCAVFKAITELRNYAS